MNWYSQTDIAAYRDRCKFFLRLNMQARNTLDDSLHYFLTVTSVTNIMRSPGFHTDLRSIHSNTIANVTFFKDDSNDNESELSS